MKKNIFITVLAATAFMLTGCRNTPQETDKSAIVLEAIATRTSIRAYENKPVEADKVEKMLRAAMAAPSAINKQPWAFVVLDNRESLDHLADSLPRNKMLRTAPLAIVVCGDMSKAIEGTGRGFWIQDASAATENMLLAAHALGLGAVWTGVYPDPIRTATVSATLGLPSHIIPLTVVPIGYPAESPTPKDKWKPENIHYNKW